MLPSECIACLCICIARLVSAAHSCGATSRCYSAGFIATGLRCRGMAARWTPLVPLSPCAQLKDDGMQPRLLDSAADLSPRLNITAAEKAHRQTIDSLHRLVRLVAAWRIADSACTCSCCCCVWCCWTIAIWLVKAAWHVRIGCVCMQKLHQPETTHTTAVCFQYAFAMLLFKTDCLGSRQLACGQSSRLDASAHAQ